MKLSNISRSISNKISRNISHKPHEAPTQILRNNQLTAIVDLSSADLTIGALSTWGEFSQGTAGARPTVTASIFGTVPGVVFDGGDYLSGTVNANTIGTIIFVIKTPTTITTRQCIFSVADSAAANKWFQVGIDSDARIYAEYNNAGSINTVKGSSFLDISTSYIVSISLGVDGYYAEIGGIEENPLTLDSVGTAGWFGSVTGTLNATIGACVTSGGAARFFSGTIGAIQLYNTDLSE